MTTRPLALLLARRTRALAASALAALLAASLAAGLAQARPTAQTDLAVDVSSYTLDNGLTVILARNPASPTVAVTVWYAVGGANDPPGRSGFAHLFEHMMFQGSANVPRGQHSELVTAAGGFDNATTDIDRTEYYEALPAHQLPLALWLEADRMRSLVVDAPNFDREREVVKEEYRLRIQNQPYGEAILLLQTLPYDYPPYRQPVIGSIEDLDGATFEDVLAFHRDYYKPNNATLAIAGGFDPDQARELVDRYFADIPRQDPPPPLPPYQFTPQTGAEQVVVADPLARVPASLIAYRLPSYGTPDYYAAAVLSQVLGQGSSSRLAVELVDQGLAVSAETGTFANRGPSLFYAILIPAPEVELEEVEDLYYAQLEQIAAEGVDDAELEKAVNQVRSGTIFGLETSLALAQAVQSAHYYLGDARALLDELERYRAVTSEDLQRVATTYLGPDHRTIIRVEPAQGGNS